MKLKTLLLEYNDKVAKYSDELGEYLAQLRPSVKGWKFSIQRMTGTWEWNNRKFEDAVYATWGWEGKNEIPIETSDGESSSDTDRRFDGDVSINVGDKTIEMRQIAFWIR